MSGSTTTFAELQANVAYWRPTWTVTGPVAETVPPVQSGPTIGGTYTRTVYRVSDAAGVLQVADYDTTALNGQFLALIGR
jgi:hypothetical protein